MVAPYIRPVNAFMAALDGNKDGQLSQQEFREGFPKWFESWSSDHSAVTEEDLRGGYVTLAGAERDYGCVATPDGRIDLAITTALPSRRRAAREEL